MSYFLVIKYKAIRTKGEKNSKKIKTEKIDEQIKMEKERYRKGEKDLER